MEAFCLQCGKAFQTKPSIQNKYCCRACYLVVHSKTKVKKVCHNCGKEFSVPPVRSKTAHYCSRACLYHHKKVASEIKTCLQCGAKYKVYPRDAPGSKFCSRECKHIASTVEKECAYCGTRFTIKRSDADTAFYCCKSCATEDYKIRYAEMTYDRVDQNQAAIVEALRAVGAMVMSLTTVKNGCPDLLVYYHRNLYLLEVKSAKGKLTPAQIKWHAAWPGAAQIVHSKEEALAAIGAAVYATEPNVCPAADVPTSEDAPAGKTLAEVFAESGGK